MNDFLSEITKQLGGNFLDKVSSSLGTDKSNTEDAIESAIPMILKGLQRNVQNPRGAESLSNALEKDHDGSVFNQLDHIIQKPEDLSGSGILKHIFGPKQNNVEAAVSKTSGLNHFATGKLMQILAPIIMGQLGRQKRKENVSSGGIGGLLNSILGGVSNKSTGSMGMIESLLDRDGDGDISDDLLNMGGKFLGGLFRGR